MNKLHKIEYILHRSDLDVTLGDAIFLKETPSTDKMLLDINQLPEEFWTNMQKVNCVIFNLTDVIIYDIFRS